VDLTSRGVRGPLLKNAFLRGARRATPRCLKLFDPEVTAYEVRLPKSRRYGEGNARTSGEIVVYSTTWSRDCRRARRVIALAGLTYREIDRD
jgi:hypothetical protein